MATLAVAMPIRENGQQAWYSSGDPCGRHVWRGCHAYMAAMLDAVAMPTWLPCSTRSDHWACCQKL